jgi:hypothetical protein
MPPGVLRGTDRFRPVPAAGRRKGWDDPRLVGLKLIFLIVSRAVSVLGLSRRESWWEDAEIVMLRHQLAVAKRERPMARARLTWPDRARLALLAGTVPIERLVVMRLIVTPGTGLRWHRDIVRPPAVAPVAPGAAPDARLAGLGTTAAPATVWQILKTAGIEPAPRRDGPDWAGLLRSEREVRPARPGRQLHRRVRPSVPGRWRQGHPLRSSGAPNELDHGTLDRQLPA